MCGSVNYCTGLSDTCLKGACQCGNLTSPCNTKNATVCTLGKCMCGGANVCSGSTDSCDSTKTCKCGKANPCSG